MFRLAKERFVIEYVKEIRSINKGLGGEKLWIKYKSTFGKDYSFGRDVFARILSDNHLKVRKKRRKTRTTNSNHNYLKYPDLIKTLKLTHPHQVWVSDITYIPIKEKSFCFLSILTDAYTKEIIGFSVGETLETSHTLKALKMALDRIGIQKGLHLIHHSDRGVQYACNLYTQQLRENNIRISMTESGDPKDNAIAERVNGIIKQEFLNHLTFKHIDEVKRTVERAVKFYNTERPHRSLNMMTPIEAAKNPGKVRKLWKSYKEPYLKPQYL